MAEEGWDNDWPVDSDEDSGNVDHHTGTASEEHPQVLSAPDLADNAEQPSDIPEQPMPTQDASAEDAEAEGGEEEHPWGWSHDGEEEGDDAGEVAEATGVIEEPNEEEEEERPQLEPPPHEVEERFTEETSEQEEEARWIQEELNRETEEESQRQAALAKEAEERRRQELEKQAEERRQQEEQERKLQEELARQIEERRWQDQLEKKAEERRQREELERQAEERKRQEDLEGQAEERRRREELARQAEEKRRQEELMRQAEERRQQEELARQEEEKRQQEELEREAEKRRKQEEMARQAEEKQRQEELEREAKERQRQEALQKALEEKRQQEEAENQRKEIHRQQEKMQQEEALRLEREIAEANRKSEADAMTKAKAADATKQVMAEEDPQADEVEEETGWESGSSGSEEKAKVGGDTTMGMGVEELASTAQTYFKSVFQSTMDRVANVVPQQPPPLQSQQAVPAAGRGHPEAGRRGLNRGRAGGRMANTSNPPTRGSGSQPASPSTDAEPETESSVVTQPSQVPQSDQTYWAKRETEKALKERSTASRQNTDGTEVSTDRDPLMDHRINEGTRSRPSGPASSSNDNGTDTPLNRLLHPLLTYSGLMDRPLCVRFNTFVAACWHAVCSPAADFVTARPTVTLLLLLMLWLAWGCAAPPEGRRAASISTVGICLSVAVLNMLKEKMEFFIDPTRGQNEGQPTTLTASRSVIMRTFPCVAPALFLSFWAPIPTLQDTVLVPPLAPAHALGSVAAMLLFAVPSYVVAHDQVSDMPVTCLWEWGGRGGFLSVTLLVMAIVSWNGTISFLDCSFLLIMFAGWAACLQRPEQLKQWVQQTATAVRPNGRFDAKLLPPLLLAGLKDALHALLDMARAIIHSASQGLYQWNSTHRHGNHAHKSDDFHPSGDIEMGGNFTAAAELCDKPRRPSSCSGLLLTPIQLALHYTIPSPSGRYPGLGLFVSSIWVLTMAWLLTYCSLVACRELSVPLSLFALAISVVYLNFPEWQQQEQNARHGNAEESIGAALNCCVLLLVFALPAGLIMRALLLGRWGIATTSFFPLGALLLAIFAGLFTSTPCIYHGKIPRQVARYLMGAYPVLLLLTGFWSWMTV